MTGRPALLAGLVVAALTGCASGGPGPDASRELSLMTFNIRYGTADDGEHAWPHRRHLVAEVIEEEAPDVLAIQEALAFQLEELAGVLEGYRKLGQHRDGGTRGEFSGLYVREGRVRIVDWGELWLSPDPASVGSVGWDAALPRMAVWADLAVGATGHQVRVYGTHFDHRGEVARVESARLLVAHAGARSPAVVMGDLNAGEASTAMQTFAGAGFRSAVLLADPGVAVGTFNGFHDPSGGERIDHILLGPGLDLRDARILDDQVGDLWPSDHFPVVATIVIPAGDAPPTPASFAD